MSEAAQHATCVVIGEAGVLIRGPSGAGKSSLALDLICEAHSAGAFARLVGDDRVTLAARGGRVIARSVAAIEGRIEARGVGLLPTPHEGAAVVRLVVDCVAERPPRLPGPTEATTAELCGVRLPRIACLREPGATRTILWRLRVMDDTLMTE